MFEMSDSLINDCIALREKFYTDLRIVFSKDSDSVDIEFDSSVYANDIRAMQEFAKEHGGNMYLFASALFPERQNVYFRIHNLKEKI